MKRIGLIINPWAGIGGQSAIKGSDDLELRRQAKAQGYSSPAPMRAAQALEALLPHREAIELLTAPGAMGEDTVRGLGFDCKVVGQTGEDTTSEDTVRIAKELSEAGVDLLVFVGGDGTARDIFRAVGEKQPCLGVPAGVKMHSAIYAVTPRQAGSLIAEIIKSDAIETQLREVMDIDEEAFMQGQVRASLYGYLAGPAVNEGLQGRKSPSSSGPEQLAGMAEAIAEEMEEDALYLIGPGSTTYAIKNVLGIEGTLLGVDAVKNGKLLAKDADEHQLYQLAEKEDKVRIIITAIGGQGILIGRGNQQLSPRVLRKCGKDNIMVVMTEDKIAALERRPLLLDSGDPDLDRQLAGYYNIRISGTQTYIYKAQ